MPRGKDITIGAKSKKERFDPPPVVAPEVRAVQLQTIRDKTPFKSYPGTLLLYVTDLPDETPDAVLQELRRNEINAAALKTARAPIVRLFTELYDSIENCAALAGIAADELTRVLNGEQEALPDAAIAALCALLYRGRYGSFKLRALRAPMYWPTLHQFREPSDDELRALPTEGRAEMIGEPLGAIRLPITESLRMIFGSIAKAAEAMALGYSQLHGYLSGRSSIRDLKTLEALREILQKQGFHATSLLALRAPQHWPLPKNWLLSPTTAELAAVVSGAEETVPPTKLAELRSRVKAALLTLPGVCSMGDVCDLAGTLCSSVAPVLIGQEPGLTRALVVKLEDQLRDAGYECPELVVLAHPRNWKELAAAESARALLSGMTITVHQVQLPEGAEIVSDVPFREPSEASLRAIPLEERAALHGTRLAIMRRPISDSLFEIFTRIANAAYEAEIPAYLLNWCVSGEHSIKGAETFEKLRRMLQKRGYLDVSLMALKPPECWPLPEDFLQSPTDDELAIAVREGPSTVTAETLVRLRSRIKRALLTLPGVSNFQDAYALAGLKGPSMVAVLQGFSRGMAPASYAKLRELFEAAGYEDPNLTALSNPRNWPTTVAAKPEAPITPDAAATPTSELIFREPSDDELRAITIEARAALVGERLGAIRKPLAEHLREIFGSAPQAVKAGGIECSQIDAYLRGTSITCPTTVIDALRTALHQRGYRKAKLTALRAPECWPLPKDFLLTPTDAELSARVGDNPAAVTVEQRKQARVRIKQAMMTLPGVTSFGDACTLIGIHRVQMLLVVNGNTPGMLSTGYVKLDELLRAAGYESPNLKVLLNPKYWLAST